MKLRRHARLGVSGTLAIVAVCAGTAWAQAPTQGRRGGGLLPARETPSISGGQTRDEMLRQFDLDADGRIDAGEAEAARTRMRREKIETLRNSGLDPLTGRPREPVAAGESAAEQPPGDDELLFPSGSPTDAPRRKPATEAEKKPTAKPAPSPPAGRAPAMTGGVRAGAPAVRPGYGATGPKQELNAGRPREPQVTPGAARVRTGMQPAGRPLQQPATPRASAPRPSLFPQGGTRPTAEDIGR